MSIHPTAIISEQADIASDVVIGPYAVIIGQVTIGSKSVIHPHVIVGSEHGVVHVGKENVIHSGAILGGPPQDLSFQNEATSLEIGDRNIIRECVTVSVGTDKGGGRTCIGNDNLLMAYVHIAHDCHLGDRVVMANLASFAGHVTVEDDVKIGGNCCFTQFLRLGRNAYIAADSTVNKDILPFTIAQGKYALPRVTNKIGLERSGFDKAQIENIHKAIRYLIKGNHTIEGAVEQIRKDCDVTSGVEYLIDFVLNSQRGIAR